MSLYAANGITDASGIDTSYFIGGAGINTTADTKGPLIQPFLNNYQFINGGTVNDCALLLVKLSDSSGINTIGNGLGHDITAIIDGDERTIYVLNNFYENELDSYQGVSDGFYHFRRKAFSNQSPKELPQSIYQ